MKMKIDPYYSANIEIRMKMIASMDHAC